jgi:hypothetical protein
VKSKSERIVINTKEPLRILALGDVHAPYQNDKYLSDVAAFAKDFKPNFIVQIGDLYDQYTHSKYSKSLNVKTPKDEDASARKAGLSVWQTLQGASPKAQCFQLRGNHCVRAYKRILEKAPDLEEAVTAYYDNLYSFRGVRTLVDDRSELVINGILFIHGYLANLGDHVKYNRQSTVVGHSHRGGVVYSRIDGKTVFELNCGHVADDEQLPFSYTPQRTNFWTPGFGVVETLKNGVVSPRFIPL